MIIPRARLRHTRLLLTAGASLFLATAVGMVDGTPLQNRAALSAQAPSDTYRNVYDGWKWWHVYCYRCHGVDAIGTTNAPSLTDPNRRLSSPEFLRVVSNGIPDKGMQGWDKLLDPKQINQIYLYVRARTDNVLPPGRPDEVGPNRGAWVPPNGWPGAGLGARAAAQKPQERTLTAIGPVLKISGDTLVIDAGKGKIMQFVTNTDTQVKVSMGGAKEQAARAEGRNGLKITEVVHEGDQVFVRYSDVGGTMVVSEVDVRQRRPQSALPVN